ncbi:monovalent cation/H(+) antiporter subunit G [Kineococcus sp. SYSU DK004]|uniref:monovalent cation/H(+) antiporter subunit G n=1 Tax=Kineococcus sp. SYSU DK004 TaxID=3383125 RepID=UPI003D7C5D5E
MSAVLDVVSSVLVLAGAAFAVTAGVGLLRFRDLWLRMHAGTKPQVLGVVLVALGVALQVVPDTGAVVALGLVAAFQVFTAPVSAHVLARTAHRSRAVSRDEFVLDELASAGRGGDGEPEPPGEGGSPGGEDPRLGR